MTPRRIIHNQKLIEAIIIAAWLTPIILLGLVVLAIIAYPQIVLMTISAWIILVVSYTAQYVYKLIHK